MSHVLTKIIEDFESVLDRGKNVGLLLLDLGEVFDCLPHVSFLRMLQQRLKYLPL